jgi:hypothetical protein
VEVSAQEAVNAGDRQSSSEILRETDLQNHFREKQKDKPSPAEPIDKEIRERLKNDIQLNTALNILKSLDLFSDYRKEQTSRK